MGKRVIISQADFSESAIPVAKAVEGTSSPQFIYAANQNNPSDTFDWESCKIEVQVLEDGCITVFNIPETTAYLPKIVRGGDNTNNWLKEIDLSFLSCLPLVTITEILSNSLALERVTIGGKFSSLTGSLACSKFVINCPSLKEVVIDKSFKAPLFNGIVNMFYESGARSIIGLKYLITSNIVTVINAFYGCNKLKTIDLHGCDTSNVENFNQAFYNCGDNMQLLDISDWNIKTGAITTKMFFGAKIRELNANCFTALYGDINGMFYLYWWNTIHLDNLNDVSAVTNSTDLFSSYVSGTPKVTIANVTNSAVKTLLINALNNRTVGGSSSWHEDTINGVLCLVP